MPNQEFSGSGAPVYHHQVPTEPISVSAGNEDIIRQIDAHITRHVGQTSWVFHEVVSPLVHVDIHVVAPSAERPFYVLVTSGMSERAMKVPPGAEGMKYAELVLCLPATIPLREAASLNEE